MQVSVFRKYRRNCLASNPTSEPGDELELSPGRGGKKIRPIVSSAIFFRPFLLEVDFHKAGLDTDWLAHWGRWRARI